MSQEDPEDARPAPWLRRLTRRGLPPVTAQLPAKIGLRTSISEFLLVTRLRARNLLGRRGLAAAEADAQQAEMMARYAHVLSVTCKNWFPEDTPTTRGHQPKL
jgi:hypothetical protein